MHGLMSTKFTTQLFGTCGKASDLYSRTVRLNPQLGHALYSLNVPWCDPFPQKKFGTMPYINNDHLLIRYTAL
jgi:hypothetical protein